MPSKKAKQSSKKSSTAVTPTAPAAQAQEVPAVQIESAPAEKSKKSPAPAKESTEAEKPFRFAKGTRVRYRAWDVTEGPLDREGTVTGHGPKWISINRVVTYADGRQPKVVPDWADANVAGSCEAIETSQTA